MGPGGTPPPLCQPAGRAALGQRPPALPPPMPQAPARDPRGHASLRVPSAALRPVQACPPLPVPAVQHQFPAGLQQRAQPRVSGSPELQHRPGPSQHHKHLTQPTPATAPPAPGLAPRPQISLSEACKGASAHSVGTRGSTKTCPAQRQGTRCPADRQRRKGPARQLNQGLWRRVGSGASLGYPWSELLPASSFPQGW